MVLPNTELEKQRVLVAEAMGLKLDPRGTADLVVVILLSVVYSIDFITAILVLVNRKYPPLKSKGPIFMVCVFIGSIFWFTGDIHSNGLVTIKGSTLTNCSGWAIWVRIVLSVCGYTACLAIRSYSFYRVFRQNLPARGLSFLLPIAGYFVCLLIYGIVFTALGPSKSAYYIPELDLCELTTPLKATRFVFLWCTGAFTGFIFWKIRNIKSSFREVCEMLSVPLVILAGLLINTVILFKYPLYPLNRSYRIALTLVDAMIINVLWRGIIAKPLFNCLFGRNAYLQEWKDKLCKDGLQREYQLATNLNQAQQYESRPLKAYKQLDDPYYGTESHSTSDRITFR